ncbi:MAG: hypothetical protein Q8Q02_07455, partial [Nocardioides sp.]|nr:hypothetical protein [Nocardioides sp.]
RDLLAARAAAAAELGPLVGGRVGVVVLAPRSVDLRDLGIAGGTGVRGRGLGGGLLGGPDLLGALTGLFLERGFLASGVTHVNSMDPVDRHRLRQSSLVS